MNPNDEKRDEERVAALFAAVDVGVPPPDQEFLDRLREQSAEVFESESAQIPQQTHLPARRHRMFVIAMRGLAACAAAVVLGTSLWFTLSPDDSGVAFGKVLDKLADAKTLHLEITRQGKSEKVWARKPDQLRWTHTDGTYKIARGTRLWLVDEKANRATSQACRYFRPERQGLDLFALLELPTGKHWESLLGERPVERVRRAGLQCDLYRMELPAPGGKIQIEALVDAGTQMLRSLEAKAERRGRLEPIGKVNLLAFGGPVPEELFVLGDTLTEDGRVGKVTDAQGIVSIKPVMHNRWTPVDGRILLKPGDWVRTDVRGANAVALRLVKQTDVTLGPGSLVEVVKPNRIRVLQGELKVVASAKAPLELIGPRGQKVKVKGTQFYRLDKEKFFPLEKQQYPLWLKHFEGSTSNESIGSLVAKVEGRNVPLTVRDHQVTVDIRDQIARTVIEESFVNNTDGRLEGVFYFPLPQDASISGFGMWIGDKLVNADVVEKQRAREIYETILRERRDPGLLEWTGGNMFKARVFPIEPHSDKRIKITYTQVLPLKGNRYRYSYGLQSEMLKQHPLRELAIDVKLNSVMPLKSVTSPTHPARIDQTGHSAHVEFSAQEYTPERDFEVVVEVDGRQSDVVVIPHQRGEDGYFMLQLTPPAESGQWQREVLPDGEPMEVLILADTSASMDAGSRATQAEFIASLLSALTAEDKINLAACDVDCHWAFEKPAPADAKNVKAARRFLADRLSLGWTDLDKAFDSALKQCGPKTSVIYVGDGIVTTGDADPVAFSKRLRRLYSRRRRRLPQGKGGAFHAVTVASSFEPLVLKTIASLGGGSFRQISGEQGPQAVALELLGEMARPGVRDLEVEFRGLRTARVYPEELPNIPAGSQQILLGRYLPEGRDQTGEVIVSGTQDGKSVRFRAPVSLKDAEQGNSFIPRLWARMHLDVLLEQGATSAIKDEIIALSEEYHIITPYTSLLVLESDADRERFKVKRRFQMRDGERFFAEGRETADYELVQQQMKRAGNWRLGLRRAVLRQLAALARDARLLQPQFSEWRFGLEVNLPLGRGHGRKMGGMGFSPRGEFLPTEGDGKVFLWGDDETGSFLNGDADDLLSIDEYEMDGEFKKALESGGEMPESSELMDFAPGPVMAEEPAPLAATPPPAKPSIGDDFDVEFSGRFRGGFIGIVAGSLGSISRYPAEKYDLGYFMGDLSKHRPGGQERYPPQYTQWLNTLFPHLPPPPPEEAAAEPKHPWPADARALAESLLRTEQLAELKDGLRIDRRTENFDVRWGELTSRSQTLALVSPDTWLTLYVGGTGSQTTVHWCGRKQRGVFSRAFQLGRVRASTPRDLRKPPLALSGHTLHSLYQTYPTYTVELKPQGDQRTLMVLKDPTGPQFEMRVLVDTGRHVVLSIESLRNGKVTSTEKFEGFVEVAGCWWAGRIERTDAKGRRTSVITQEFKSLTADVFNRQLQKALAGRERVQFLHEPLATVADAKQAVADEKATFDDHLALLLHFARSQQWDRVMAHLQQAENAAAGKPGMWWVRNAVLNISRRREELKKRIFEKAGQLAKQQAAASEEFFLAEYLRGRAANILQANEMLALLDLLKPLYRRQPPYLHGMKRWNQQRINYLQQTGQTEEALGLQKQLAQRYPRDYNVQQQYAQAMVNAGEYEAAYAWLRQVLAEDAKRLAHEEASLRNVYVQFLRQQGRYPEMTAYLADWVKRNPQSSSCYHQYLSALIRTDRVDEANALIARWLKEGKRPAPLAADVASRLGAAVSQSLGQGYNMHTARIDERWLKPLADAALFFARHKTHLSIADQIMGHHRFRQSDDCRRVRKVIAGILTAEIDKLRAGQIQRFVQWIWPNDPAVEVQAWKRIADRLQRRWSAEADPQTKNQLAQPLIQILSGRLGAEEYLAFLRLQLREGPEEHRANYARQLFNALLAQSWSAKHEDEAFALLKRLSEAEKPAERLLAQVGALYGLTDRMVRARFDAEMKKIEHQEKLTRTELRDKQQENLRLAREGFADRLGQEVPKHSKALGQWLNVERLYLDTLLGRNLKQVEEECWEFLGPKPRKLAAEDGPEPLLQEVLRSRHLVTLANLAARRGAKPALVDRLLKYVDGAIEADAKDVRWKLFKHQLLIALDRPKDLEDALRAWIRPKDANNYWRLSLGYLLAEQGKIQEAIRLFEAVEAADELGPTAYRTLADWYMVVDRREAHDQARIAVYKMMQEWRLSNWISGKLRPWRRREGRLPSQLDKNVLLVFAALFEKSGSPHNYLWQLREFYQATRDFRLLEGLSDAVVGHTAVKVYPFLQGMQSVLSEVRDEATADSIVEHLAEVRRRAATDIDHRALDLLELLVERRSAEVINQPGPHVDKALAAMQRAFKRKWTPGEPRLMADFLAGLGRITQAKLADEQMRQLEALHGRAAKGSANRLHIAHRLAQAHWSYSRYDEAIDLIEAALDEYQDACGGVLPVSANGPLDTFVRYLEQRRHYARGEKVLLEQLRHPVNKQQTFWLTERLYQLYENALANDGDVSLGAKAVLYRALEQKIRTNLETADHNHRYNLINRLCRVYRTAHGKKFPGVAGDLRAFAFKQLPKVLKRQTNNYQSIVGEVARTLHDLAGARDGLAFLIERIEQEPSWFRYANQDGWRHHGSTMGYWRTQVKQLGDLEQRLLKIVLAELRWDLESRQARNRSMYHRDSGSRYWKEKEDAFAKVTEEVYARRKQSGAAVRYIADYFYRGLHHYNRAIEILLIAHKQEILDETGQRTLVQFLHEQSRYGESIAILQPLVERRPDNMQYRVWLMSAYFHTNRPEELLALLKQTDEYFHQQGRWTEGVISALAESCLNNQLYEQSVAYYEELIPLHQRTHPRRGIGNGTLSTYYGYLARAYAALKNTTKAVDAACGAIVSWGRRHDNRAQALEALKGVLRSAPDLDGYVAELDKETEKTGLHNPIVRKALGQVYFGKKEYAKAITQLKLACELQPNDTETHKKLIECYDEQEDKEGAVRQVLASLQLSRRDIKLYQDLGQRLKQLGRPKETERAYTSIVEVLPNESESHTLLAEIRQQQDRWDEAILHWQHIARIRALEPTGLFKLAAAQIHQEQWDRASETLRKLDGRSWPSRFGDVHRQVRDLQRQIEQGRKP